MASYLFVLVTGLVAGAISGVIGTGASILLMPALVIEFGPQQAVPIMAVASLLGNIAKAAAWWRQIDWRAFWAYSLTGVPMAAWGAHTLLALPPSTVEITLGIFFLSLIPIRRAMRVRDAKMPLWLLAVAGGAIGFLTGIVISTGPLSIPAFAAVGLGKGALLSTEAAATLGLMISKVGTFHYLGALPWPLLVQGLIVGGAISTGIFVGKQIVDRMSLRSFEVLLDIMLVVSGLTLIWTAVS